MAKKDLTNWQAIGIGGLVAISASLIIWRMPFSVYFLPFVQKFTVGAFPLSILGALVGKYIWKDWSGSLFGAVLLVMLEFWLISTIASMLPLD
jgi:hypothetical protein